MQKNPVTFYIPTHESYDDERFLSQFGSIDVQHATGYWIDSNGTRIPDNVTLITSLEAESRIIFYDYAVELCKKYNQDCIALEYLGDLALVDRERKVTVLMFKDVITTGDPDRYIDILCKLNGGCTVIDNCNRTYTIISYY